MAGTKPTEQEKIDELVRRYGVTQEAAAKMVRDGLEAPPTKPGAKKPSGWGAIKVRKLIPPGAS